MPETPTFVRILNEKNLGNGDCRHSQNEGPMLRLVPEQIHAEDASDAASKQGGGEQGPFRDPPEIFPGLPLVRKHKQQGDGID